MAGKRKQEVITFKVDDRLSKAMRGIPNRSEFIRSAIQAALVSTCPLCGGSGSLTPDQWKHWQEFAQSHAIEQCRECAAVHLVCTAKAHPAEPSE